MKTCCPSCGAGELHSVMEFTDVPGASCFLFKSREQAQSVPLGELALKACLGCGLYFNSAYDPTLCRYEEDYEETQGYSPSFRRYLELLVDDLVLRHGLNQRNLLEIGCGKGEFLALLCERGGNAGTGYDPAFRPERHPNPELEGLTYYQETFTRREGHEHFDAIFTRMTLEHIPDVFGFLRMLREGASTSQPPLLYTQVPNSTHLIENGLVCDLVHEHCNYFTEKSLSHALAGAGFEVTNTIIGFGGQHLALEARPAHGTPALPEPGPQSILDQATTLRASLTSNIDRWNQLLGELRKDGKRVVIWGSGSKATAFLTTHECGEEVIGVIDINPNRTNTYMAGTGHIILGPDALLPGGAMDPFDVVIVMNPIYIQEIRAMLESRELNPRILAL